MYFFLVLPLLHLYSDLGQSSDGFVSSIYNCTYMFIILLADLNKDNKICTERAMLNYIQSKSV